MILRFMDIEEFLKNALKLEFTLMRGMRSIAMHRMQHNDKGKYVERFQ